MSKKHKKHKTSTSTYRALPLQNQGGLGSYTPKSPKLAMMINGVRIYGSSVFSLYKIPKITLRIDVSGLPLTASALVAGNSAARALMPDTLFPKSEPVITIDWADGTAHSLDRVWWETLISTIETLPEGSSVVACCVGGTGRTGTVLAVLAGLSGQLGPDDTDPVEWLRDHYYSDAVESENQMWYVEDITGLMVDSDPSDHLYRTEMPQHGTQVLGIPDWSQQQGAVTGPLGGHASVGASDHTGS